TWTWEMLRHWKPGAVLAGNLRVSALEALPNISPDTPVVLELSSFQLEGLEEPAISPHLAAVTNLSPDHMDRYPTMAGYGEAKKHIFKYQRGERGDCVVLNSNDPIVSAWAAEAPAGVAWFGLEGASRDPGPWTVDPSQAQDGPTLRGPSVMDDGRSIVYRPAPEGIRSPEGPGNAVRLCAVDEIRVPGAHNLANAA